MFNSIIFVPDFSYLFERSVECRSLDEKLRDADEKGTAHEVSLLKMKAYTLASDVLSRHELELFDSGGKKHETEIKRLKHIMHLHDRSFWSCACDCLELA